MIEDIRIADAGYFPEPCAMWKGMRLPKPLSDEFMRAWSFDGLRVVASAGKYGGQEWLHVSYSRSKSIPSYRDTQLVLKHFFQGRKAVMVFPEEEHYVNIHPNCLHLWYSAANPLPDFDENGSI